LLERLPVISLFSELLRQQANHQLLLAVSQVAIVAQLSHLRRLHGHLNTLLLAVARALGPLLGTVALAPYDHGHKAVLIIDHPVLLLLLSSLPEVILLLEDGCLLGGSDALPIGEGSLYEVFNLLVFHVVGLERDANQVV